MQSGTNARQLMRGLLHPSTLLLLAGNLIADVLLYLTDPRIRVDGA